MLDITGYSYQLLTKSRNIQSSYLYCFIHSYTNLQKRPNYKMAGIIAQITRANRERIEKRKFEVGVSKCMYELKPFGPCFKAEVGHENLL